MTDGMMILAGLAGVFAVYSLFRRWYNARRAAQLKAQAKAEEAARRRERQRTEKALGEPLPWVTISHLDTGLLEVRHEPARDWAYDPEEWS